MIDSRVVGDLIDPGGEFELGSIASKRVIDLDKNLLRQIQSRLVIADHSIDVGGYGTLIATHEFLEASFAAVDGARHQIAIVRGAKVLNKNRSCRGHSCIHIQGFYVTKTRIVSLG